MGAESRCGINVREEGFEMLAFEIRVDIWDRKSPEQICVTKPQLSLTLSTLYSRTERGYFSMFPMDFRWCVE